MRAKIIEKIENLKRIKARGKMKSPCGFSPACPHTLFSPLCEQMVSKCEKPRIAVIRLV